MFLVGITGGIGSGKTTVCKIFEVLGVPVYYADERAKWLLNNDTTVKEKVVALLGNDAYSNGELNRPLIAEKVPSSFCCQPISLRNSYFKVSVRNLIFFS
jgi:dephospho-CoA kinase